MQIANLTIDESTREVSNQNGKTVSLRPLAFSVLMLLIENKCECVSREDFFINCWGRTVVSEQALTNVISTLRRVLTQLKVTDFEIKTVSKVGYLLSACGEVDLDSLIMDFEKKKGKSVTNATSDQSPIAEHQLNSALDDGELSTEVGVSEKTFFASYIKAALGSKITFLFLVSLLVALVAYKWLSNDVFFINKNAYKHFMVGKANIYIQDNSGFIDIAELNSFLNRQYKGINCPEDIFIRIYHSSYVDDAFVVSAFSFYEGTGENMNHLDYSFDTKNYKTEIKNIITEAGAICD